MSSSPWACPVCTFNNHPDVRECELCTTPKGGPSSAHGGAGSGVAAPAAAAPAVEHILLAVDYSGSTGVTGGCNYLANVAPYHDFVSKISGELPRSGERVTILLWDHSHEVCTSVRLADINRRREGRGGTDSSQIATWIRANNFHGKLVIITDGQVKQPEVDRCDTVLGGSWTFADVVVHIFDTGGSVNLSVSAPFTRASPSQVIKYMVRKGYAPETDLQITSAMQTALAALDAICTQADFSRNFADLQEAVIARTMGTRGNAVLHDAFTRLKSRLTRGAAAGGAGGAAPASPVDELHAALLAADLAGATDALTTVVRTYYGEPIEWMRQIDALISMCSHGLSTFDAAAGRLRRAPTIFFAPPADLPLDESVVGPAFECPIAMEDTKFPILLMCSSGTPLLRDLDPYLVALIKRNPFEVLKNPDLIARILTWLDCPMGLEAYQTMQKTGTPVISPFTRKLVESYGGLCLAPTEASCKTCTWAIANICGTGRKLIGNADIWFAVLWQIVVQTPRLKELEPHFRAQMCFRLEQHKTNLSLGGNAAFVVTRAPLSVAVWSVCNSGALLSLPAARDPIRAHFEHADPLLALLALTGFPMPVPDTSQQHILRTRVLDQMLWEVKKGPDARRLFKERIRALTQNALRLVEPAAAPAAAAPPAVRWIPLDGAASPAQVDVVLAEFPALWRELPLLEMVHLGNLVDPSKMLGGIEVHGPYVPPVPAQAWNNVPRVRIAIHPATCRPPTTPENWKVVATRLYGPETPTHKWFSTDEYFNLCVLKMGRCPTVEEYIFYVFDREIAFGTKTTLPQHIWRNAESVIADHAPLIAALGVATYLARQKASMRGDDRVRIEYAADAARSPAAAAK